MGTTLELPAHHRVPVTWIREHACAPIRLRTALEILPPGTTPPDDLLLLREEADQYRRVKQAIRKQWQNGSWSGNMLGVAPMKSQGIKDVGTVAQYRHLLELGLAADQRAFRLADRLLFRVLARDEDRALLFEYQKASKTNPPFAVWARDLLREGATCALARAGRGEDPRVRGAAHRIISNVSHFLRSELSERPLLRRGPRNVLHPEAHPPTVFVVALLAYIPRLQRERAGFVERLGAYLSKPTTKRAWVLEFGRKAVKPTFYVLGDPLHADASGNPEDLPLAVHWIELLVRLGLLEVAPTAQKILTKLLRDCDEQGVWSPPNLRSMPHSNSKLADFACPLELDSRAPEVRRADVTFRLALIAKLAGWDLQYT